MKVCAYVYMSILSCKCMCYENHEHEYHTCIQMQYA